METPYVVTEDIHVLPSHVPVPGYGILPVNAFVLKARSPVLVDAGVVAERDDFLQTLFSVIDPQELQWIWLTHTDPDHIGALRTLLDQVAHLRVITTFLGAGKLGLTAELPMERLYFLNPGQSIDVGDRELVAIRPPTFDAPETTALFDTKSRVLFSSDCFGAVLTGPARDAGEIPERELADCQTFWALVDSPWLQAVDAKRFEKAIDHVRGLAPTHILSSHLPPAADMLDAFVRTLGRTIGRAPFVGPDQAALRRMMA